MHNRRLGRGALTVTDRKSTRLNSSHGYISYAVFCLKKKKKKKHKLKIKKYQTEKKKELTSYNLHHINQNHSDYAHTSKEISCYIILQQNYLQAYRV